MRATLGRSPGRFGACEWRWRAGRACAIGFHARISAKRPFTRAGTSPNDSIMSRTPGRACSGLMVQAVPTSRPGQGVRRGEHVRPRRTADPSDCVEDGVRGIGALSLFEPRVVTGAHPGELGELLAAQTRHPAPSAVGAKPDVLRPGRARLDRRNSPSSWMRSCVPVSRICGRRACTCQEIVTADVHPAGVWVRNADRCRLDSSGPATVRNRRNG